MSISAIYADFHNADPQGRLRLTCHGTTEDLRVKDLELKQGLHLTFSDGELKVDGTVEFSTEENRWVAVIDWCAIEPV